jgi:hypothetical protein
LFVQHIWCCVVLSARLLSFFLHLQDCCGMGRAVEAGFDAAAFAWWVAGAITLGLRASEANSMGIPQQSARNAIVALSWLSAAMFLALLMTNLVLIKKLGE